MSPCSVKFSVLVAGVLVAITAAAGDASAQAWVGDKGALDLSLDYNLGISDKVVGDDQDFENAGSTTHQLTVGAEYVPVRRLAVNLALPYALLKYTGDKTMYPHGDGSPGGGGSYDDGSTHATLTDMRIGARYQVLEEPVALSPHLGFSIPLADYETVGNTVAGRHLKALHLGLGAGYVIGAATYLHLIYEFSLVEKYDRTPETAALGQNRSDLTFTVGHKLLDQRLDLHADFSARITHGGVSFSELDSGMVPLTAAIFHDPILKEDIFLAGIGLGYQISNALSATLAARLFVAGANTQNASVLALGLQWSPL